MFSSRFFKGMIFLHQFVKSLSPKAFGVASHIFRHVSDCVESYTQWKKEVASDHTFLVEVDKYFMVSSVSCLSIHREGTTFNLKGFAEVLTLSLTPQEAKSITFSVNSQSHTLYPICIELFS